ncbi:MAG: chemotaxis protein CheA [Desulfovibrio sp.]|nr:chemotaxis protein CheA [Desulfovibrio sp.]
MFVESCLEQLSGIESAVLDLEKAAPEDRTAGLEAVFRAAHTIKSDAAAMGAAPLSTLCHAVETVLAQAREGRRPVTAELAGELLRDFDQVAAMVRRVREILDDPDAANQSVRDTLDRLGRLAAQKTPLPSPAGDDPDRPAPDDAPERIENVTIPARELDILVDRIGELGIVQARLEKLARGPGGRDFLAVAEETGRLAALLRDQALGLRLLPLRVSFPKYRRLVRDACARLGKDIELVLSGERTELDKTLIERLNTPVLHLLRNAVDHGIEPPEIRRALGKPGRGRISLSARQEGNGAVIEIADDGAGIDADALWDKACARGLADPGRPMTWEERLRLAFLPGLSTAPGVGEVSGRGVGMDAAREGIASLRGSIGIDSAPGRGTTFTIRLPVSLAIIDCLEVRAGDGLYFFHLDYVEECLEMQRGRVAEAGRRILALRGEPLPVLCLTEFFGFGAMDPARDDPAHAVVVRAGGKRFCIAVDEVLGQKQAVLKNLGPALGRIAGILGGTVTEDGHMALVLDVPGLARAALSSRAGDTRRRES